MSGKCEKVKRMNDEDFEKWVVDCVKYSLLHKEGTATIREKLGVTDSKDFIRLVAEKNNLSLDEAKERIVGSSLLMRLMFAIA
jgi:hypothetical protein